MKSYRRYHSRAVRRAFSSHAQDRLPMIRRIREAISNLPAEGSSSGRALKQLPLFDRGVEETAYQGSRVAGNSFSAEVAK